ncbi:cyclic nucleotide-binding domain-containing protein [Teichococcus oryzae]|uniref:Cyclic nucleotide-binding domain-containing protein n=1 Tax=Teichococcus oryzae TaxID=1608942 RepID=A0A5B2TBP1_9PROT|nr:cyclic nucleotide-binding domain-containing protein [Pseudoroseomonas oryzae]KAA2211258.1 cyclic nucleotide-binding domain-containing protein [Pseudoroseomonas oryzae]
MDADLLQSLPPGRDRRLARGEMLFRAGDSALGLVLVHEGVLELARTSPEGRRLVLHRAGAGDTFAEASLFESHL